ncbi:MAG TPA: PaaX family transcriptional regulator C-terminal domain-containing protein [Acidimicrobiales bacterium]|nr:PaaX family transcriptional regulator C-terminal domain-containing protein [Acidimicrobiales bacterium]
MGDTTVAIPTRVLVLGMAHENGTILSEELLPVAEACGLTGDQVRSCLRRLVAEGLFVRQGTGRKTTFAATAHGMTALGTAVERTRLAYVQDAAGRGWDRQWRLVAFAVPEKERAARDAFRDHLIGLGGAAIQGGLYVSPHPWHKDAAGEAERLGIAESVTYATTDDLDVGGEHDPRKLASTLWPIEDLAKGYERFNDRHHHIPDLLVDMRSRKQHLPDSAFLPAALAMTVAYDECAGRDPLLPPELLPRPWPGRRSRELLMSSRRLALALRKGQGRPALFRWFDEAIETIP